MEFRDYQWWTVRDIVWCGICSQREVNGPGADLCASCQAVDLELEEMCRS